MISLKNRVKTALTGACETVIYGYPLDMADGARVCWRESMSRRFAQADGCEHLAELNYTVDVFDPTAEGADAAAEACDTALCAIGLRREDRRAQLEADCAHITLRYRAVADADGGVYQ